jgi:hypothetical protein
MDNCCVNPVCRSESQLPNGGALFCVRSAGDQAFRKKGQP